MKFGLVHTNGMYPLVMPWRRIFPGQDTDRLQGVMVIADDARQQPVSVYLMPEH